MHAKRIRNLLTAVLMTGAVLGNAGTVPAEEIPDDALSVSAASGAEEELPGQEQEEPVSEEMAVLPSDADTGEEEMPSEMEVPSSGSEAEETVDMSSSSGMEESPPGTGDGTDPDQTSGYVQDTAPLPEDPEAREEQEPYTAGDTGSPVEVPAAFSGEMFQEPETVSEEIWEIVDTAETEEVVVYEDAGTEPVEILPLRRVNGAREVRQPESTEDFRFWTVAKVYAFAKEDTFIFEEKDRDARKTGKLKEGALCFVIHDEGDGWLYVESGDVRGFISAACF